MQELPAGRVAFVFTDIEGSTALLTELGDVAYQSVLGDHDRILREAMSARGGVEVSSEGDGLFVAFADPADAVLACCEAQLALAVHPFGHGRPIRVRMGVHVGEAHPRGRDYIALAVNQAARVMAAAHGGQVLISAAAAEACDERVDLRRLGLFLLKDFARAQPLVQAVVAGSEHPHFQEPRTPRARPHGVPLSRTSFVGRADLLEQVADLVRSTPLVSLVGTGGVGKTRLAHELAQRMVIDFPGGVHCINLASLTDPAHVPAAVATGLGVTGNTEADLLARIEEHLGERRTLVVLDNCERLLDAVAEVTESALRTGVSHVLTTGRERVDVPGEVVVDVEPLAEDEAALLFGRRVSEAGRRVALPREAVLRICRQLDGLPLGIELAAARARALDAAGLERLVADPLSLTGGRRGEPALRRMIERSHELLSPEEQLLFRWLAVFAGGWDLSGAEAVCRGLMLSRADVAGLLASLVEKSLVVARHGELGTRYAMLELLRSYAVEQLVASGDEVSARRAHRHWCRSLTAEAAAVVDTPAFRTWLPRLDLEHANLLAALTPAEQTDAQAPDALEDRLAIVANALPYWIFQSRPGRRSLMRRVHADSAGCPPAMRAVVASELAHEQRGTLLSRELLEDAVGLAADSPGVQSVVLSYLAEDLLDAEDLSTGLPAVTVPVSEVTERARALAAESGSVSAMLSVEAYGANVLLERCWATGDFAPAEAAYRSLLEHARTAGSLRREAFALIALALIDGIYRLDPASAEASAQAAVTLLDGLGERSNSCLAHSVLALAHLERDDLVSARRAVEVAVDMAIDSAFRHHEELAALALGALLTAEGALHDAAVVLGFLTNDFYDTCKAASLAVIDAGLGVEAREELGATGATLAMRDLPGQPHAAPHRESAAQGATEQAPR